MKRTKFTCIAILLTTFISLSAKGTNKKPEQIQQWLVKEFFFVSAKTYKNGFSDVNLDVVFSHSNGIKFRVPAFWDGGNIWKVRFAPTQVGEWTYRTVCSDSANHSLHNQTGVLLCSKYRGTLDIYKHGFVKTLPDIKYLVYDDDTPFFYLGDTHWNMPAEQLESSSDKTISSQFRYLVDKRIQQGFTVYQSEPLAAKYNLRNGVSEDDLAGFRDLDAKFKYIAEKGLVHANAELFFPTELGEWRRDYSDKYLELLCRYWVARFGAYPVLWTTAQECDNDYYHDRILENGVNMNPYFDKDTNPWKMVAEFIHRYDAYKHPLSAHQEYASIGGQGTIASTSSFRNLPSHSWFAAQWSPAKNAQLDFNIPRDFLINGQGKPAINYEGSYDHLWTNEFGARMQGWTAYLNGMFGIGYGAEDIWYYNSKFDIDKASVISGITITVDEKKIKWPESVELPSAYQMNYLHQFFKNMEWWKLTPRFDDATYFNNDSSFYSLASVGRDCYVIYFYNKSLNTGTLKGVENKKYVAKWFNPRTGLFKESEIVKVKSNDYIIGNKPDENDWVLLIQKN